MRKRTILGLAVSCAVLVAAIGHGRLGRVADAPAPSSTATARPDPRDGASGAGARLPPTARRRALDGDRLDERSVTYSTLATSDPAQTPPPTLLEDEAARPAADPASVAPDPMRARYERDLDRYLVDVVAPRARDCWKHLDGAGQIEFLYLLRHETGIGPGPVTPTTDIGIDTPVSVVASDLTPEQSKRALDCMLDAVAGTSFTTEMPRSDLGPLIGKYQVWQVGKPLVGPP